MTDRPILFSAPMVRALLDSRKTQTRRALKPQPTGYHDLQSGPYKRGDRLWVREAWNIAFKSELAEGEAIERTLDECVAANRGFACPVGDGIVYKATGAHSHAQFGKALWRSPLHMFRWASRLTLIVTDVRVQRLQDISEDDAEAEGCRMIEDGSGAGFWVVDGAPNCACADSAIGCYENLWDSINTKSGRTWADNPWVVALTFDVHRCNIDALEIANG